MKLLRIIALICLLPVSLNAAEKTSASRPNIVFVLADDLGFTDIAPYGSEVSTPTLSALAEEGMRFTNYHTAANCAPARAMLLTGVSNHLAGVPNIPEMLTSEQRESSNYQGVLGDDVVTVATLLKDAGYHTYMAGKWHLGKTPEKRPSQRGFQRTVALMDSGADHWEQRSYLPLYVKANWYADGEEYTLPQDFYSSRFLVDKMIEFIDSELESGQPFFAYLPFMAVHIPVQAPQEYSDRYMGVYDSGWDALRQQRFDRAVELGIVPASTSMVRMPSTDDWAALSDERRRYESKRMAVYAGMIEAMDYHLGRLITYLRKRGQYDNTIFIFTSDNGTEASGPADPTVPPDSLFAAWLGYHLDYEHLGLEQSYNSISPSFASASASPLAYYKFYTGEGGMRVPLMISGAPVKSEGGISQALAWATDITPTILALAGVAQPEGSFGGRPVLPMTGRDLSPLLSGDTESVYGPNDTVGYELTGHGALFQGDYKIVVNQPPLGDGQWRLYNIVNDPGETQDLAALEPARMERMLDAYSRFERDNKVVPMPPGFSPLRQLIINSLQVTLQKPIVIVLLALVLLALIYTILKIVRNIRL